jgi:hypothetical protein
MLLKRSFRCSISASRNAGRAEFELGVRGSPTGLPRAGGEPAVCLGGGGFMGGGL